MKASALALDLHKHLSQRLAVHLRNLCVVLPQGELLAATAPRATIAELAELRMG